MTSSNGNIFRVTGPLRPVDSSHKGQWRGALKFFICTWTNSWALKNRDNGDFRRHRANCDVNLMGEVTVKNLCYGNSTIMTRIATLKPKCLYFDEFWQIPVHQGTTISSQWRHFIWVYRQFDNTKWKFIIQRSVFDIFVCDWQTTQVSFRYNFYIINTFCLAAERINSIWGYVTGCPLL